MESIFKNELKQTRFGLLIWSVVVVSIALFGMLEYPIVSQNIDILGEALLLIPKIGQLIFGVYNVDLTMPIGYHIVMYYWLGLIVFAHAMYTGASIISKETRDKTAEFLFTKPYKRSTIIWAKILAGFVHILIIGVVAVISALFGMTIITTDPGVYIQILISGIGMFFTQCILLSLGLLCSAVFKTYRSGTMGAVMVLLASYCLMFFVQFIDSPALNFLSPLTFFGVSDTVENGFSGPYILLAVLIIGACLYLTQWFYARKDMI